MRISAWKSIGGQVEMQVRRGLMAWAVSRESVRFFSLIISRTTLKASIKYSLSLSDSSAMFLMFKTNKLNVPKQRGQARLPNL